MVAMITRIAYGFLIFSFLGYTGCYHTSQLTKEDLDEQVSKKVDVVTVDSKHYQFDEGFYHIHGDTLHGEGIEITGHDSVAFVGTVPVNTIEKVELRTFDYGTTAGLVAAGLGVVAIIVVSNTEMQGGWTNWHGW
jgi:hypothetical protein